MAILVGPETKVICQGMTGRTASYHIERAGDVQARLRVLPKNSI